MKKVGKVLLGILQVIIVVYVIAVTACLMSTNDYNYTQFGNDTLVIIDNSNVSELSSFKEGDLVVIKGISYGSAEVGDTIYYYDALTVGETKSYIIRQGVISEKQGDSYSAIYVIEDKGASIASTRVIGELKASYHSLGSILSVLETQLGFLLLVILPIFVVFIYQVYKIVLLFKFGEEE